MALCTFFLIKNACPEFTSGYQKIKAKQVGAGAARRASICLAAPNPHITSTPYFNIFWIWHFCQLSNDEIIS